jgi:uncharacterized protein
MGIWAIADLHLAIGVPEKAMDFFGEPWIGYQDKIKKNWVRLINDEDLVLIAGDISWAMKLEHACLDLEWIHQLPGTKVILKGNHDYWWSSLKQIEAVLPSSIHLIQNNAFTWKDVSVGGARLWDTNAYQFNSYINYIENSRAKKVTIPETLVESERKFEKELVRLETSLKAMDKKSSKRIVMTHYPPISADLKDSKVSFLLEKYNVNICVFGHLHNIKKEILLFGTKNGISYLLTAADYLNFIPLKIFD